MTKKRIPRKIKKEMKKRTGLLRRKEYLGYIKFIKEAVEWELAKNGLTFEDIASLEIINPSQVKVQLNGSIKKVECEVIVNE